MCWGTNTVGQLGVSPTVTDGNATVVPKCEWGLGEF